MCLISPFGKRRNITACAPTLSEKRKEKLGLLRWSFETYCNYIYRQDTLKTSILSIRLFQVYGSIESYDGYERFEFHHSYSNVHPKPAEYSPGGAFMSFELSNVEDRNRVKCLSGQYGELVFLYFQF